MSTSSQVKRLEVDDEHLLTSVEHRFSVPVSVIVGLTVPVSGFAGLTGGFRICVFFSHFPVFKANRTGSNSGSRSNRLNRPVRSGF